VSDSQGPASSGTPSAEIPTLDIPGFAERLLAVIDDGRRTATYKLALLMALSTVCLESGTLPSGNRYSVSTRRIASLVAEQYWRQLKPFPSQGGPVDLRQITNKSAAILTRLASIRDQVPSARSWHEAFAMRPDGAARVLDHVELTVARFPILRLQVVDGVPQPFIYDVGWFENVTLQHLHQLSDHAVVFRPGAVDQLVRLSPLVRPLVESHWVRMVSDLNDLTPIEDDLRRHLFGSERIAFPPTLRQGLGQLQQGMCFYCTSPLESRTAIDHFFPWARWPNDAIENLVIAHATCNGHKSDRIPGPTPLARWTKRLQSHQLDLRRLAVKARWDSAPGKTVAVATSLYGHLPEGTPLWDGPGSVVGAHPKQLLQILGNLNS
jgi:5-methylcytosine-specific restriction endonuclease McrA